MQYEELEITKILFFKNLNIIPKKYFNMYQSIIDIIQYPERYLKEILFEYQAILKRQKIRKKLQFLEIYGIWKK